MFLSWNNTGMAGDSGVTAGEDIVAKANNAKRIENEKWRKLCIAELLFIVQG
jgi:hypothetical protein